MTLPTLHEAGLARLVAFPRLRFHLEGQMGLWANCFIGILWMCQYNFFPPKSH